MQTLNEADELAAMGNGLHAWRTEEFAAENAAIAAVPSIAAMVEGGLEALTKATSQNSLAIKVAWVHNGRAIAAARELCEGNNQKYGQWVRTAFGPEAKGTWATDMAKTYEQFYDTPLERLAFTSLKVLLPQTEEVAMVIELATAEVLKGNCPTRRWLKGKLEEAVQAEIARKAAMKGGGPVTSAMSKLTDIANGTVEQFVGPVQPLDNDKVKLADTAAPTEEPTGAAADETVTVNTIQRLIEPSGYLSIARDDPRVNPDDIKVATAALSRIQQALEAPQPEQVA